MANILKVFKGNTWYKLSQQVDSIDFIANPELSVGYTYISHLEFTGNQKFGDNLKWLGEKPTDFKDGLLHVVKLFQTSPNDVYALEMCDRGGNVNVDEIRDTISEVVEEEITSVTDSIDTLSGELYNLKDVVDSIKSISEFKVVDELPESGEVNVIYLVKNEDDENQYYNQYVWSAGNDDTPGEFKFIGSTDVALGDYVTNEQLDAKLEAYATIDGSDSKYPSLMDFNTVSTNLIGLTSDFNEFKTNTTINVASALEKANAAIITAAEISEDVINLKKTVGDESSGLVRRVNNVNTTVASIQNQLANFNTDVKNVKEAIGNVNGGLTKQVNDMDLKVHAMDNAVDDVMAKVGKVPLGSTVQGQIDNLAGSIALHTTNINGINTSIATINRTISDLSQDIVTGVTFSEHVTNADIHVSTSEKNFWNGKQDALGAEQLAAINSGITLAKVVDFSNMSTNIQQVQQTVNSHVQNVYTHVTADERTRWNSCYYPTATIGGYTFAQKMEQWDNKQPAIVGTQLDALNSGITELKVGKYDTLAANITVGADTINFVKGLKVNGASVSALKSVNETTSTLNLGNSDYKVSIGNSAHVTKSLSAKDGFILKPEVSSVYNDLYIHADRDTRRIVFESDSFANVYFDDNVQVNGTLTLKHMTGDCAIKVNDGNVYVEKGNLSRKILLEGDVATVEGGYASITENQNKLIIGENGRKLSIKTNFDFLNHEFTSNGSSVFIDGKKILLDGDVTGGGSESGTGYSAITQNSIQLILGDEDHAVSVRGSLTISSGYNNITLRAEDGKLMIGSGDNYKEVLTNANLAIYATKSDLDNLSGTYATKGSVAAISTNLETIGNKVTVVEGKLATVGSDDTIVTESVLANKLEDYALKGETTPSDVDLTNYYTKDEVDTKLEDYALKGEVVPGDVDLDDYYTKNDIDGKGFITADNEVITQLSSALQTAQQTIEQLQQTIAELTERVATVERELDPDNSTYQDIEP